MWPFKAKPSLPNLVFKSGEAFFEYQCSYGVTEIKPKQGLVAIVVDSKKEFGTSVAVKVQPDGQQSMILKVVSSDGGFYVNSYTASSKGAPLAPGDCVIWVPVEYSMPPNMGDLDDRFGWVGFIVAKIAPEIDPSSTGLKIVSRYH